MLVGSSRHAARSLWQLAARLSESADMGLQVNPAASQKTSSTIQAASAVPNALNKGLAFSSDAIFPWDHDFFPFPSVGRDLDKYCGLQLRDRSRGDVHSLLNMPHAFDVVEHKDKFELVADAPGMSPDEVKIELHEGVLNVSGSHEEAKYVENPPKGEKSSKTSSRVIRSERKSYQFSRTFTLPETANPDAITASMDKGVLTVSIGKRPEPAKPEPKRIPVNASLNPEPKTT